MSIETCLQTACNTAQKAALAAQKARDSLPTNLDTTRVLVQRTDIPDNVDLDVYTTTGLYHQNLNAQASVGLNYPIALAGMLEVVEDGLMVYQEYKDFQNIGTYTRVSFNGVWSAWSAVAQNTKREQ